MMYYAIVIDSWIQLNSQTCYAKRARKLTFLVAERDFDIMQP
mgnify:CR=1 FL=1